MDRWIANAKLIVLSLFLTVSLGTLGYHMLYVWPAQRCETRGAWWDARDRQCLTPLPIWRITHRAMAAYAPPVTGSPPETTTRPPPPSH